MAKNGWKLSKVAITGSTRSLLANNGRNWVLANQVRPTALSAAIVSRYTRFWPKKHRELPVLAIAHKLMRHLNSALHVRATSSSVSSIAAEAYLIYLIMPTVQSVTVVVSSRASL